MKKKTIIFALLCFFLIGCASKTKSEAGTDYRRDYLIVVNEDNPYEFGGEYDQNLITDLAVTKQVTTGDDEYLEYRTLEAFSQLRSVARKEGIIVGLLSGYRTKSDQDWLYENNSLTPQVKSGYSEHHTGLSISIVLQGYLPNGEGPYFLSEGYKIPENERLTELLPDYGFIRRYPEGKEDITGHVAAPYEIRFVGDAETAHAIMDNNLCLEEYVQQKRGKIYE